MKRSLLPAFIAAGLAAVTAASAAAEWPNDRPIRLIVGFGAGGGTDIVSRIIAQPLSELLARPETRDSLAKVGALVHVSTPEEFHQHLADEVAKWRSVRDKAGIEQQ